MARSEDDVWDITESVGATALGAAGGRAAESESDDPLISDPYAAMFLDAAGWGAWVDRDEMQAQLAAIDPQFPERMAAMTGYMASRTKFFDDFFRRAVASGITQAVILAAGLDARAWRLDWPAGCRVFELDQPKVLEFKTSTLAARGISPAVTYVEVPVDLRHDWPAALRASGFDDSIPAAWTAEGLLPYLPGDAQNLLFERVYALSAPGSRVAVESFTADFYAAQMNPDNDAQTARYREVAAKLGRKAVPSPGDLFYTGERADVVEWLNAHGWQTTAVSSADLMAGNGRHVPEGLDNATPHSKFVEGTL